MSCYSIEEYNPEWVTKFQNIKHVLEDVFSTKALAIEHVGSTSIPRMKAKPIIDILVIVENITTLHNETGAMFSSGYQLQENYVAPNTLLFRRFDEQGNKLENIHVCERGAPMEKQFLNMRDYLRTFPDEVTRYAQFKDELIRKFPNDYESYRAAKNPFLKELEQRAYRWEEGVR